jgi:hypothetical protein
MLTVPQIPWDTLPSKTGEHRSGLPAAFKTRKHCFALFRRDLKRSPALHRLRTHHFCRLGHV